MKCTANQTVSVHRWHRTTDLKGNAHSIANVHRQNIKSDSCIVDYSRDHITAHGIYHV